jgi:hypothetical protein
MLLFADPIKRKVFVAAAETYRAQAVVRSVLLNHTYLLTSAPAAL